MENRQYLCIDLKSFYASVECVERSLDPMTTNLVVADPQRKDATICLAVSPSMKKLGVKNRCRVYEIPKHIEYIKAPPRMRLYIEYSADIYAVYLKYVSKEDIHVYSIDEAFLDVTHYLSLYKMTAKELGETIRKDILKTVGIPAACGIGTNLYLAKIALDITAKKSPVFLGELDEKKYRETLWDHRPITDFWHIGKGTAQRLENNGMFTMGDVARCKESKLYELFGINAEILIDHAFGREPTTIADIKAYKAQTHCLSSGQVLMRTYGMEEGMTVLKEMVEPMCIDMVNKGQAARSVTLTLSYADKQMPSAHGTQKFSRPTASRQIISEECVKLYKRIFAPRQGIRKINITLNDITADSPEQFDFFDDSRALEQEKKELKTVSDIKKRFGKNSILRALDLKKEATAIERNRQIGGHKSGEGDENNGT